MFETERPRQGFFRMRAARRLRFGLELVADDPVHGAVGEVNGVVIRQVLLDLAVAAKTPRLVQPSLQLGQDCGGNVLRLPGAFLRVKSMLSPPFS